MDDDLNCLRRNAVLLRVGVAAEGVQAAKLRTEFPEYIDCDIRADLDIAAPHALQEGRLMREIAGGVRYVGNDRAAVSAGELGYVDGLVAVVLVRQEAHLQRVPRTLKAAFATAIDVSRIRVHQRGAALMNRLLAPELGQIGSNALGVARETTAPLPGLIADLLPIRAADGSHIGKRREERIVPEVVPAPLASKRNVAIRAQRVRHFGNAWLDGGRECRLDRRGERRRKRVIRPRVCAQGRERFVPGDFKRRGRDRLRISDGLAVNAAGSHKNKAAEKKKRSCATTCQTIPQNEFP
jgi:hypothetical protein